MHNFSFILPEATTKFRDMLSSPLLDTPETEIIFPASTDDVVISQNTSLIKANTTIIDDEDPIYLSYRNLIIDSGCTLTTTNHCRGLYIFVSDTLTLNGTISMSDRGSNSTPKYVGIDYFQNKIYYHPTNIFYNNENDIIPWIGAEDGIPNSGYNNTSDAVDPIDNRQLPKNNCCGGGGGTDYDDIDTNISGGIGTAFCGGGGAGGYGRSNSGIGAGYPGIYAAGGDSGYIGGVTPAIPGGGAGYPVGSAVFTEAMASGGGGGLIIIITNSIVGDGYIKSDGSDGGFGIPGTAYVRYSGGSGGGAGGGSIQLFYKSQCKLNNSHITAIGGSCPRTHDDGTIVNDLSGSDGSIRIQKI